MDIAAITDIETLRGVAQAQQMHIKQLLRVLEAQHRELEKLDKKKGDRQQLLALMQNIASTTEELKKATAAELPQRKPKAKRKKKRKKKRKGGGPRPQPKLPVVEQVFTLDDADKFCESCGGELSEWLGEFEESEMIDVIDVRYELVKVKRQKYTCQCGSCIDTAIGPERATPGSRYSLEFASKVLTDKYLDHLPLARQGRILKRHGANVFAADLVGLGQRSRARPQAGLRFSACSPS